MQGKVLVTVASGRCEKISIIPMLSVLPSDICGKVLPPQRDRVLSPCPVPCIDACQAASLGKIVFLPGQGCQSGLIPLLAALPTNSY